MCLEILSEQTHFVHFQLFLPAPCCCNLFPCWLWHGECSSTHRFKPILFTHILPSSYLEGLRRTVSSPFSNVAQPQGQLHADSMQIFLTITDTIRVFPNYALCQDGGSINIPSSCKLTYHHQLKEKGKKEKEMVSLYSKLNYNLSHHPPLSGLMSLLES